MYVRDRDSESRRKLDGWMPRAVASRRRLQYDKQRQWAPKQLQLQTNKQTNKSQSRQVKSSPVQSSLTRQYEILLPRVAVAVAPPLPSVYHFTLRYVTSLLSSDRIESYRIESNRIESNRIESNRIESDRIKLTIYSTNVM
jgi:hypothetical protein